MKTLLFLAFATCVFAAAPGEPVVHMIGDSTMADKPLDKPNPERGWGQLFPRYFKDPSMVKNHALNGRSSKSFRDEGHWQPVFDSLKPGDFVIIQFGHNDEKKEDPKRYADPRGAYEDNLLQYIRETRSKGAIPILATPINRREFGPDGKLKDTHGDYPPAVREIAAQELVPVLDMHRDTKSWLEGFGPEKSTSQFVWVEPGQYKLIPEGRHDNTHLDEAGAIAVAGIAAKEVREVCPELALWLK